MSFAIVAIMLVAIFKVHITKGFFAMNGGFEYQFLILLTSIALLFAGAGRLALYNTS